MDSIWSVQNLVEFTIKVNLSNTVKADFTVLIKLWPKTVVQN